MTKKKTLNNMFYVILKFAYDVLAHSKSEKYETAH